MLINNIKMNKTQIHSFNDLIYGLNLAEQIELYDLPIGTTLESLISGEVIFQKLESEEPRICVLEDGERVRYFSDGKLKSTGSQVLKFTYKKAQSFIDKHINSDGNPINLPDKLSSRRIARFLKVFSVDYPQPPLCCDWMSLHIQLKLAMKYFNAFSLNDKERKRHKQSRSHTACININQILRDEIKDDASEKRRYLIVYQLPSSMTDLIHGNLSLSVVTSSLPDVHWINGATPYIFINECAANSFINAFKNEIIKVINDWRAELFQPNGRLTLNK